jgi:hypothetical protein
MTILEKFFLRFLKYKVSRNIKLNKQKKLRILLGLLMLGKLWMYIGHTIVPYYTTIQDQPTFNAYHPILSSTHRLAVYFMVLLYGGIS